MDGEERNASLPILGSHGIFDPGTPLSSQGWPCALSTAARPHRGAAHASRKVRVTQRRKKCKKSAPSPGNLSGQELRGPTYPHAGCCQVHCLAGRGEESEGAEETGLRIGKGDNHGCSSATLQSVGGDWRRRRATISYCYSYTQTD